MTPIPGGRGTVDTGDRPHTRHAALSTLVRPDPGSRRIGLMGGSFNPAHDGHRMIALLALRRLRLDRVWWLVSPQNPLKSAEDMAPLADRLAMARRVGAHPAIEVTALESDLGTAYTVDTVRLLRRRCPRTRFVWLMGADNFRELPDWQDWKSLMQCIPVAVFARPGYGATALSGTAARAFPRARIRERAAALLAARPAPAWAYLHTRLNPASATRLRDEASRDQVADLLTLVLGSLDEDSAQDVLSIDLAGRSTIGDYMVIASGRSSRHVTAMAEHLLARLKPMQAQRRRVEGLRQGDWVLIDAGDVIVHLFRPDVREFYGLDKMWTATVRAGSDATGDSGRAQ